MEWKEKVDLVVNALSEAVSKAKEKEGEHLTHFPYIELYLTSKNKLSLLDIVEIQDILTQIQDKEEAIVIEELIYPKNKNDANVYDVILSEDYGGAYFEIEILKEFDNFLTAHHLRKNIKLEELSGTNFKKICDLVSVIDEKFQFDPRRDLIIPFEILSGKFNKHTIHEPLQLLRNRGITNKYQFTAKSGGIVEEVKLEINIQLFLDFKKELEMASKLRKQIAANKEVVEDKLDTPAVDPTQQETPLPTDQPSYNIEFTQNNEILINGLFFKKPHFDNENGKVFRYLIENPKKDILKKEIQGKVGFVGKDLRKIVENLGFSGVYRRVFFKITKDKSIYFRNPVTNSDLKDLRVPFLPLPSKTTKHNNL